MAERMRRAWRATKAPRVVQAAAFEVVDATGAAVARLGPMDGAEVGEPAVGLVLYGSDGSARLTIAVGSAGSAIHLTQDGNVRCSIAVIDGEQDESSVLIAVHDKRGREVASLVASGSRA